MKKLNSFLFLFFVGCLIASATGSGEPKLSLDISAQKKIVKLDDKIKGMAKQAAVSRVEEENWTLLGTGKYTDDIMTNSGLPSATWDVEIYESVSTPGFYRVKNPYGNGNCPYFDEPFESCDFLMHAENPDAVWMEYVELKNIDFGLTSGEYCPAFVGDYVGYYVSEGYFDAETAIAMGLSSGKMFGGSITFDAETLILNFPLFGDDGLSLAANVSGLFCVALPGALDYGLTIETESICTDNTLTFAYKTGKDIAEVKYDMYEGLLSFETQDDELFEKIKSEGKKAADGSVTVVPEYGVNTVAVVAMDADGAIVRQKVFYCFGQQDNPEEWTSIGNAEYSEDVLASIYPEEVNHVVYEVEVQESNITPGRYRLVDLYGPAYPYYQNLVNDNNILPGHDHHHYVTVDATNPEMVYIEASPLGADFGYGQVMMFSEGWLAMQKGADLTSPEVLEGFGKLKDGKITFLGGAIFLYMPEFGMPRGNIFHKFYIKIPDLNSISDLTVDLETPVYYNLSGLRVASPTLPGIYVKVQNGIAKKIYVK